MKNFFKNNWFIIVSAIGIFLFILYAAQGRPDFNIYVSAARDLLLHKNIYTILYHDWFHYFYGVLFALVLTPISFLPFYVINALWLILNVFFLYRIWTITREWLPLSLLNDKNKLILTILTFLFMFRFIRDNFRTVQVTIFMLYIILEGISLITKEKIKRGAALIAFGIEVKILPLFFYHIYFTENITRLLSIPLYFLFRLFFCLHFLLGMITTCFCNLNVTNYLIRQIPNTLPMQKKEVFIL